jgi:hypothetical protein
LQKELYRNSRYDKAKTLCKTRHMHSLSCARWARFSKRVTGRLTRINLDDIKNVSVHFV